MSGKTKIYRYRITFDLLKERKINKDEFRNLLFGLQDDDEAIEFLRINLVRKETV